MLQIKPTPQYKNISLDLVCTLLKTTINSNSIGVQEETISEKRQVFCAELPVSSSEFFTAGQSGINPEKLLLIDSEEYDGETSLDYDETKYIIYRNFTRTDGLLELYCRR
jgi:hypothetical protein